MSENNLSFPAKAVLAAGFGAGLTPDHMSPMGNIAAGIAVAAGVHVGQKIKSNIEARRKTSAKRTSEFHDSYGKQGQVSFNEAANWDKDF